ncbi:MAG: fatty acid cis/trans isomerase [Propionivibrio sp.]|uniref:fatty acid cis/trans isomerase n=1 Tax=Propionivibrio sp. TaxID=2212460 RepID=UPI001A3D610F|nr:fatty acid cis/trans isomerase [Propionivibrio sp.]MBL8414695.1 fatty acid cis/trans isomerase [Propionivibrio sp.]
MRPLLPLLIALVAGCATIVTTLELDERFGKSDPARFDHPVASVSGAPDYWQDVRPILDRRCVACHSCYDAPCQLNLASYSGITRGANPAQVYANRLLADPPTRLGFDALSNAEWRRKGFFPVLNERAQTPEANREGGVMYRLLALKQEHPGPDGGRLNSRDIDISLGRAQICVTPEAADHYTRKHPERGMPFALPPLSPAEQQTLERWLESGAPYTPAAALPSAALARVVDWESFLNGDSAKEQLVTRYIYEHWYAGHLYFAEAPGHHFELVRSRTAPGQAIDVVATRRPFDDPGVPRIWYRLRPLESTPVAKTFMPLKLDGARMERLRGWFLKPDYLVTSLPGYDPEQASNPFATFRDLPVDSRYRFMLDDARFIMQGFMMGPVCRGQVALNVIQDQFWVVFRAPDSTESQLVARLLDTDAPNLQLPAAHRSNVGLLAWRDYAKLETRHLQTKSQVLAQVDERHLPTVEHLWDGDGGNPTAGLTVIRHFDSASVIRGLVGERPQTAVVFGYPLFERMHYLLLAGFDIYGNIGHQLATRLYMDFLRMEGELDFLALLPIKDRQAVLDHWYRGRSEPQTRYLADANAYFPRASGMRYHSADTLGELYAAVRARVAPVRAPALDWKGELGLDAAEIGQLKRLSSIRGIPASVMPELSILLLQRPGGKVSALSLVRNSAHSNVAQIFDEDARRLPGEDTLLALDGIAGAYPNALFAVDPEKLPDFVDAVARLSDPASLTALTEHFGVRRSDRRFWPLSDALHAEWRRRAPDEAAVLDYSRLENN